MKILALEPYYGQSHKHFLDRWQQQSSHSWTNLTLPDYKWKWRMRHSAITFARQTEQLLKKGQTFDLVFCSDMLNLAEFIGLSPALAKIPKLAYFHENQLTYPVQAESERDYQFAFTNISTALAADKVWFNSDFHRRSYLVAAEKFLKKMPDHQPFFAIDLIKPKTAVFHPGIDPIKPAKKTDHRPTILWAARWEHDKNPEDFFKALEILKKQNTDFRLNIIGRDYRTVPPCFEQAKKTFAANIDNWGYQPTRQKYEQVLAASDIFVSTAYHEFFGISAAEAISAGCTPILPDRLAYPELLNAEDQPENRKFLYKKTPADIAEKITYFLNNPEPPQNMSQIAERFNWQRAAVKMDKALEKLPCLKSPRFSKIHPPISQKPDFRHIDIP